jgi:hypothetical protein
MINSYETACTGMGLEISSSSLEQLRRFSRDAERGRESLEEILQTSQEQRDLLKEQRDLLKDIVQGSNDLKKNYLAVDECLSLLLEALSGDPVDERKFLERCEGHRREHASGSKIMRFIRRGRPQKASYFGSRVVLEKGKRRFPSFSLNISKQLPRPGQLLYTFSATSVRKN